MTFTNPLRLLVNESGQDAGEGSFASRAIIRYHVPGETIQQAYSNLSNLSVFVEQGSSQVDAGYTASIGSTHPEVGSLKLYKRNAQARLPRDGVEGWIVEAEYGIEGFGTFTQAPDNTTEEGYYQFSFDFGEVDVPIPVIRKVPLAVPAGPIPQQYELSHEWTREDQTYKVRSTTINITFNVPAEAFNPSMVNQVDAQVGKLHKFGGGLLSQSGRFWLFQTPSAKRVAKDVVQFSYTWVSDPGNASIDGLMEGGQAIPYPEDGPPSPVPQAWPGVATLPIPAREPFQEYAVIYGPPIVFGQPPLAPAIVTIGPRRTIDEDGHLSLPLITANASFPL